MNDDSNHSHILTDGCLSRYKHRGFSIGKDADEKWIGDKREKRDVKDSKWTCSAKIPKLYR